jgi:hypothetical protein
VPWHEAQFSSTKGFTRLSKVWAGAAARAGAGADGRDDRGAAGGLAAGFGAGDVAAAGAGTWARAATPAASAIAQAPTAAASAGAPDLPRHPADRSFDDDRSGDAGGGVCRCVLNGLAVVCPAIVAAARGAVKSRS